MDQVIERKRYTPKKLALATAVVAILFFGFYNLLLTKSVSSLNINRDRLTIGQVQEGDFQEFIAVDGSVDPLKTFYLDIMEGGRVERIYSDDGRMVQKGDTLLKFSNTTLQIDFMTRETQLYDLMNERQNFEISMKQDQIRQLNALAEIEYNLQTASRTYKRNQLLITEKAIPQEEFEASQDQFNYLNKRKQLVEPAINQDARLLQERLRQLDESIRRMQANINMARHTLNSLYVTAPISGQLSTLKAQVGESKAAGENIGQIDDLSGYKIRASIDEHYISKVYPGLTGNFTLNGQQHEVEVIKVFPEVQNGTFKVDMEFVDSSPRGIRRGQSLQLKLTLNEGNKAILIPRGSFYQSTGGNYVFVLDKTGSFAQKRPVRLGRQNPQYYEVLEGLQPGEKVIVSSYDSFGTNERLQLK
ncbi:efflux RND transporter periplasmic adaptor subunit [Pontibacter sp. 13R65]|uniref:efflux RND transporter periplasmic adaptor subunit n=1 Tax=Pontibacter sp. 13R65 TaxID=3127458 RepID=UPI00301BCE72